MPATTDTDYNFDDILDDVDLGADAGLQPGTLTRPTGGVMIYPHGYSVRLSLSLASPEAALQKCGWSPSASSWLMYSPRGCNRRYVLRGSAWLTGRAPNNRKLPLARSNREWRTKLYSVAVDQTDAGYTIDLQGVRYRDVRRFAEEVLCLSVGDYNVEYFRVIERYIVLHPHDAHRLAAALGGRATRGAGRLAAKLFLLRDYPIPITIRRRTPETALLTI